MQIEIIKSIQSITSPFWDVIFQLITMTGEETFYIIVASTIFWCINKKFGYKLGFALLTGTIVNTAVKDIVNSARPIGITGVRSLRLETATGQSFPSGHTQGSTTFWVSFMLKTKKKWIYVVGILAIMLVGFSRMYLGVHYPVDIIGGLAIGFIWTLISNYIFEYANKTKKPWILMIIIVPMLIGLIYIRQKTYYAISGTVLGFYIGYIVETQYIKFDVRSTKVKQLIKFFLGMGILITLKGLIKVILPISIYSDFFRYALVGLWITVGAPHIFKRFII